MLRQVPGSFAHAIYAASYAPVANGTLFPLVWRKNVTAAAVPALDVTQSYLDAEVLSSAN